MQSSYDYTKFAVLYVDDEELSLRSFRRALSGTFRIHTAASAPEGMTILETKGNEIGLLMTDQRMPGEKGVWLLEQARQLWPRIVRILVTAYTDSDAAIAAVNSGGIYNYILKPWDVPQLEKTLKRGLEFFMVEKERDELLLANNALLQDVLMAERVASLGFLAAGMSHHIRNWLVAVKTFIEDAPEQLQRDGIDCEQLKTREFWTDLRRLAHGQIRKIEDLLKELWSASRGGDALEPSQVNVQEVFASTVEKLKAQLHDGGLEIDNRIPGTLPKLTIHRDSFERLFEFLLEDEIVSLPRGSRIVAVAESVTAPDSSQTELHIRLQDNGPCLPNETLRRLFNFFAPRSDNPAESGIRLMLCYFIVLRLGGKISVTSQPGQGTTFHLSFFIAGPAPLVRPSP